MSHQGCCSRDRKTPAGDVFVFWASPAGDVFVFWASPAGDVFLIWETSRRGFFLVAGRRVRPTRALLASGGQRSWLRSISACRGFTAPSATREVRRHRAGQG